MKCKSLNKHMVVYAATMTMLLILAFLFPYSGDDWMWGTSAGMELLKNGFNGYNGRYLGNVIVLLLTRCKVLQTITVAGTLFGIAYLAQCIVNKERILVFVLMSTALILLPKNLFREAIVWTSGFSNYAISTLLLVWYLYLAKQVQEKDGIPSKKTCMFAFGVGLMNCLFIEHITLVNIALGIVLLVYCLVKEKKKVQFPIVFLMGVVIGAVIMFQNSAYHNIASESDELRRSIFLTYLPTLMARICENLENVLLVDGLYKNVVFHVGGAILVSWIVYLKRDEYKGLKNWILKGVGGIIPGYALYVVFKNVAPDWQMLSYVTLYFEIVLALVDHVAWLLFILLALNGKMRERMVYYLLAYIAIFVPLLLVTPIGPRCLLGSYVISYLIVLELLQVCIPESKYEDWFIRVGTVIGICSFIYLSSIYSYIFLQHQERMANWSACIALTDEKEVVLEWKHLPYQEYIWWPDISNSSEQEWIRIRQFKEFYGISPNIVFDFEVN